MSEDIWKVLAMLDIKISNRWEYLEDIDPTDEQERHDVLTCLAALENFRSEIRRLE